MGVVGGCARAVSARSPTPLTPLLHNSFFLQTYFEKTTTYASYFSIMSSIILSPYLTFDVTPSVITKINSAVRTCLQGSTKAGEGVISWYVCQSYATVQYNSEELNWRNSLSFTFPKNTVVGNYTIHAYCIVVIYDSVLKKQIENYCS